MSAAKDTWKIIKDVAPILLSGSLFVQGIMATGSTAAILFALAYLVARDTLRDK